MRSIRGCNVTRHSNADVYAREIQDEMLIKGSGRYPTELVAANEGVHHSNILTVRSQTLPSSTFPSIASSSETTTLIFTGAADRSIRVSEPLTGKLITMYDHHNGALLSIDFHPSIPTLMLSSSMDGTAKTMDLTYGEVVQDFKDHKKYVVSAKFSPDGQYFVSASYDRTLNIYKSITPTSYEKVHTATFRGPVESLCFMPPSTDNKPHSVVVGAREDNYLTYISLDDSFTTTTYNMNENNDDWVSFTPMFLAPSPSGKHLLVYTDSKSGRLIIFRSHSSLQLKNIYGVMCDGFSQPRAAWDKTGKYVFATSDDWKVWVIEVATGKWVKKLEGHQGVVRGLDYDAQKEWVVSCSFDKSVRIWGVGADVQ